MSSIFLRSALSWGEIEDMYGNRAFQGFVGVRKPGLLGGIGVDAACFTCESDRTYSDRQGS